MNLPIDEMLLDLQSTLETFDSSPSYDAFDAVQKELNRIMHTVENELPSEDE